MSQYLAFLPVQDILFYFGNLDSFSRLLQINQAKYPFSLILTHNSSIHYHLSERKSY